jgi:hypothetical protein
MIRERFGIAAAFVGGVSLVLTLTVQHAASVFEPTRGLFLHALDNLGLIQRLPKGHSLGVAPTSIFIINDERILLWWLILAAVTAAVAIFLALLAEYRKEATQYLAMGLISGCMALLLLNLVVGAIVLVLGATYIQSVRVARRA